MVQHVTNDVQPPAGVKPVPGATGYDENGLPEFIDFGGFAPSWVPVVGSDQIMVFNDLTTGPPQEFSGKTTIPLIANVTAISGSLYNRDSGEIELVIPDLEYSLWLMHTTLLEGFKKLRPTKGERVAVHYYGQQVKKDTRKQYPDLDLNGVLTNPKLGSTHTFHNYAVVSLDREVERVTMTWDDVTDKAE